MILDFHTHVFPDHMAQRTVVRLAESAGIANYTDGTVASLGESMDRAGITHSIQCAIVVKPGQEQKTNAFALELLERWRRGERPYVIPFASVHPFSPDWRQWLFWAREKEFLGIKLHPNYQQFYIDDPRALEFYQEAFRLGLILLFHAGYDVGLPEPDYAAVERSAHALPILEQGTAVLAHMGDCTRPDAVLELLAGSGVYMDLSIAMYTVDKDLLFKIIGKHSAERILFATDCPWSDQESSVRHFKALSEGILSTKDLENIMWNNGGKLLGIL